MKYKILGVFTGKGNKLDNGLLSSIQKTSQKILKIKKSNLPGDEVVNTKYHGGDMRVIHHYSMKHYQHFQHSFPDIKDRFLPGSFGENIVTEELTEADLNIGDIYMLGTAKVQLTVSRRPCATINAGYRDNRILKEIISTGRTGWFYRVLDEGEVKPGDFLELLESPFPNLPLIKLFEQGYGPNKFSDKEYLKRCYETGLMDKGWKPKLDSLEMNKA